MQLSTCIEQHFVRARAADKSIDGDHLHGLITLAQLIGASHACAHLSRAHWLHADELAHRLCRL